MRALFFFVLSFLGGTILTYLSIKFGFALRLLDVPDRVLKPHSRVTPYTGGLALVVSIVIISFILKFREWSFFIPLFLLFGLGFFDDIKGLNPKLRLLFELLAGAILVFEGLVIPLTPYVLLNSLLTVFFVVALINAVNLYDGMDGLVSGTTFFILLGFTFLFFIKGNTNVSLFLFALSGAVLSFYFFNFPNARIFLGDQGSYVLGFVIAYFSILLTEGRSPDVYLYLVMVLFIFALDTSFAILRRVLGKRSILEGDRSHIYDKMERMIRSKIRVSLYLVLLEALFVVLGIYGYIYGSYFLWGIVLTAILVAMTFLVVRVRLWEV